MIHYWDTINYKANSNFRVTKLEKNNEYQNQWNMAYVTINNIWNQIQMENKSFWIIIRQKKGYPQSLVEFYFSKKGTTENFKNVTEKKRRWLNSLTFKVF